MSKNTNLQRYECLKTYIQVLEGKRKRKPVNKERNERMTKYHPALDYRGE
jgi:hypothetical protein